LGSHFPKSLHSSFVQSLLVFYQFFRGSLGGVHLCCCSVGGVHHGVHRGVICDACGLMACLFLLYQIQMGILILSWWFHRSLLRYQNDVLVVHRDDVHDDLDDDDHGVRGDVGVIFQLQIFHMTSLSHMCCLLDWWNCMVLDC